MAVFFLFLRNVLLQIEILKIKIPEHSDPPSQHFSVRKAFSHFFFRRGKVILCHPAEWHIQPLVFGIQGAAGTTTEFFLSKLCENLSICTEEPKAGSFFKQRISLAIQIAKAACVLGTIIYLISCNTLTKFFICNTCIL